MKVFLGVTQHIGLQVARLQHLKPCHLILPIHPMLRRLQTLRLRAEDHGRRERLLSVALNWVAQVDDPALHVLIDHRLPVLGDALELDLVTVREECAVRFARRADLLTGQNVY